MYLYKLFKLALSKMGLRWTGLWKFWPRTSNIWSKNTASHIWGFQKSLPIQEINYHTRKNGDFLILQIVWLIECPAKLPESKLEHKLQKFKGQRHQGLNILLYTVAEVTWKTNFQKPFCAIVSHSVPLEENYHGDVSW